MSRLRGEGQGAQKNRKTESTSFMDAPEKTEPERPDAGYCNAISDIDGIIISGAID